MPRLLLSILIFRRLISQCCASLSACLSVRPAPPPPPPPPPSPPPPPPSPPPAASGTDPLCTCASDPAFPIGPHALPRRRSAALHCTPAHPRRTTPTTRPACVLLLLLPKLRLHPPRPTLPRLRHVHRRCRARKFHIHRSFRGSAAPGISTPTSEEQWIARKRDWNRTTWLDRQKHEQSQPVRNTTSPQRGRATC